MFFTADTRMYEVTANIKSYVTADTRDKVFKMVLKDSFYEEILKKYFSKKDERNEFKSELWLMLCSLSEEKILKAWNGFYFQYLYVNIIANQVLSKSSKWTRYKKTSRQANELNVPEQSEPDAFEFLLIEDEQERASKLALIDKAIAHYLSIDPYFKLESDLFKMKYYQDLTYREISKKTNISYHMVFDYVSYATILIKDYIKRRKPDLIKTQK